MEGIDRKLWVALFDGPEGPMATAVRENGAVVMLQFLDWSDPIGDRAHRLDEWRKRGYQIGERRRSTEPVRRQVVQYLKGQRRRFELRVALEGTVFQRSVWRAVKRVRFGKTTTYRAIARAVGQPTAVRAVGGANRANPVCLIVPSHRVVGARGRPIGAGDGEFGLRRRLLEFEAGQGDLQVSLASRVRSS